MVVLTRSRMNPNNRKVALVGCGNRGILGFLGFFKAIGRTDRVAALCVANPIRLQVAWDYLGESGV